MEGLLGKLSINMMFSQPTMMTGGHTTSYNPIGDDHAA
jgi:hypothetical protein